jgi:hypothetical protein
MAAGADGLGALSSRARRTLRAGGCSPPRR